MADYGPLWPLALTIFYSFRPFPFLPLLLSQSREVRAVFKPFLFSSTISRSMRIVSTKRTPINIYNYVYILIKERISNFAYPCQLNNSLGLEIHTRFSFSFFVLLSFFVGLRLSHLRDVPVCACRVLEITTTLKSKMPIGARSTVRESRRRNVDQRRKIDRKRAKYWTEVARGKTIERENGKKGGKGRRSKKERERGEIYVEK